MIRALFATGLLACSLAANAVPVTFQLAGAPTSSVEVVDFEPGFVCGLVGCGISATLNENLGSLSAALDIGQSWSFDFWLFVKTCGQILLIF